MYTKLFPKILAQHERTQQVVWWTLYMSESAQCAFLDLLKNLPLYTGLIITTKAPQMCIRIGVMREMQEILLEILEQAIAHHSDDKNETVFEIAALLEEWRMYWNKLNCSLQPLVTPSGVLEFGDRPLWMAVLNITPDSFYDGGRYFHVDAAVRRAVELYEQGADILDIGGQSTRPGSQAVEPDEEWRRLEPVLKAIRNTVPIPLSVDTYESRVADHALQTGADMINDVSAGLHDPDILRVARYYGVPLVFMHHYERIRPMPRDPVYQNLMREIVAFLRRRIDETIQAGVDENQIVVDPGIGFGKTPEHNLEILRNVGMLAGLGRPILCGPSRKSFMAMAHTGGPEERLEGTIAACLWAWNGGAHILRVHDVWPIRKGLAVWQAVANMQYQQSMPWAPRGQA